MKIFDRNILIIYEEDWWTICYDGIPQLEEILLEHLDNPNLGIINILSDGGAPYNCELWGEKGIDNFPLIINDYDNHTIGDWFGITWSSPWYLFIDKDFKYVYKTQSESEMETKLEEILND